MCARMIWFIWIRRIKASAASVTRGIEPENVRYLVSYDGRLGSRSYGKPLPAKLHLTLVEIEAGRSSQATLLGRDEMTVESLYLSRALAEELEVVPTMHRHR
jgi:DNA adenine methylase